MWKRAEALSLVGLVAVSVVSNVVIVVAEMSRGCITRVAIVVVSKIVIVVAENMSKGWPRGKWKPRGHHSNILMRSSSVPDFESNEMFG